MKYLITKMVFRLFLIIPIIAIAQEKQTFNIDRIHSKIGFSIGYAGGVIDAEGRFDKFSGNIRINRQNVHDIETHLSIDANSIDTGMEFRDKDLRSENWFHVEKFSQITFASKSVEMKNGQTALVGDLTMHGVTKAVSIPFKATTNAPVQGPGRLYVGYEGRLQLNRQDYGIHLTDPEKSFWKYNDIMESTGEMFVADTVKIHLVILAVRSGREILADAIAEKGVDTGYQTYLTQKEADGGSGKILFHERDLNAAGYQLLGNKQFQDAVKLFTYYARDYPQSANAFDSLAEALLAAGEKEKAIANYEKSLNLNPENKNAKKMLEDLRSHK